MRIGIDISQIVYEGSGVSRYVRAMVKNLLMQDSENEYVLFGSSLRQRHKFFQYVASLTGIRAKLRLIVVPFPPTFLDFLWNRLHIVPIERFIGAVDVFWSSDWTQPPLAGAAGMTTIHDVSFLLFPESFDATIVSVQKRRLFHAKQECTLFLCDSEATKQDSKKLLNLSEERLRVVYPGFSL